MAYYDEQCSFLGAKNEKFEDFNKFKKVVKIGLVKSCRIGSKA